MSSLALTSSSCWASYQIRFTWNDPGRYWKFGLYDAQSNPIVIGVKIVPRFPINVFYGVTRLPDGIFGVMTKKSTLAARVLRMRPPPSFSARSKSENSPVGACPTECPPDVPQDAPQEYPVENPRKIRL